MGVLDTIKSMLGGFTQSSEYGLRTHPISGEIKKHEGVDLVATGGANAAIGAFTPGTVIYAGSGETGSGYGGYGNTVAIRDSAGYTHVYGHLSSLGVKVGQSVGLGSVIGNQGSTGNSTGPHLHYEVRKTGVGDTVDPIKYLYTAAQGGQVVATKPVGELYGPPKDLMGQPGKSTRPGSSQFTLFGIIIFAAVLWLSAQSGSVDMKKTINGFLAVLLLSMILLNWSKISPIFFKE